MGRRTVDGKAPPKRPGDVRRDLTEERNFLWRRWLESGKRDGNIRERLLESYLPLVRNVAGRMALGFPKNVELPDLVSSGAVGLIDAFKNFDPGRDTKFETFAVPRIRGAILDELRALDWAFRSDRSMARKIEKTSVAIEHVSSRRVMLDELIEKLGMEAAELHRWMGDIAQATLIFNDELVYKEEDNRQVPRVETLEQTAFRAPDEILERRDIYQFLLKAISGLGKQGAHVMRLYYIEELTLREVSEIMNVSESKVSQVHTKAVAKLRRRLVDDGVAMGNGNHSGKTATLRRAETEQEVVIKTEEGAMSMTNVITVLRALVHGSTVEPMSDGEALKFAASNRHEKRPWLLDLMQKATEGGGITESLIGQHSERIGELLSDSGTPDGTAAGLVSLASWMQAIGRTLNIPVLGGGVKASKATTGAATKKTGKKRGRKPGSEEGGGTGSTQPTTFESAFRGRRAEADAALHDAGHGGLLDFINSKRGSMTMKKIADEINKIFKSKKPFTHHDVGNIISVAGKRGAGKKASKAGARKKRGRGKKAARASKKAGKAKAAKTAAAPAKKDGLAGVTFQRGSLKKADEKLRAAGNGSLAEWITGGRKEGHGFNIIAAGIKKTTGVTITPDNLSVAWYTRIKKVTEGK